MAQIVNNFSIDPIPYEIEWLDHPEKFHYLDGKLKIIAGPKTDMFIDPQGEYKVLNAPKGVFKIDGDFILSAKVAVDFNTDFDAGVLILFAGEGNWAKLCFEYSTQHQPMVVSVVTNETSDDANGMIIDGNVVYLRISGFKDAFAFHYSLDGETWHFVRYFSLKTKHQVKVGFSSQSPTGDSCKSTFSNILYIDKKLENLRDGS